MNSEGDLILIFLEVERSNFGISLPLDESNYFELPSTKLLFLDGVLEGSLSIETGTTFDPLESNLRLPTLVLGVERPTSTLDTVSPEMTIFGSTLPKLSV